jgi:hypothetical protein
VRHAAIALILTLTISAACSDDDDDSTPRAAAAPRRTTTSTGGFDCDPPTPIAADGTPAEVVATIGDVQVAVVDHGASVDVVSLFRGCDLDQVTLSGAPAALPIGGTVTHGDGLRCEPGRITVLSATSDDGATYQATATTYELDGTALVEADRHASTIEARDGADELRAYYELDC